MPHSNPRETVAWSRKDTFKFLAKLKPPYQIACAIIYGAGARSGEVRLLTWKDFQQNPFIVKLPSPNVDVKVHREIIDPLCCDLIERWLAYEHAHRRLEAWPKENKSLSGKIFPNLSARSFARAVQEITPKGGPTAFRLSAAIHLIHDGIDGNTLRHWLRITSRTKTSQMFDLATKIGK